MTWNYNIKNQNEQPQFETLLLRHLHPNLAGGGGLTTRTFTVPPLSKIVSVAFSNSNEVVCWFTIFVGTDVSSQGNVVFNQLLHTLRVGLWQTSIMVPSSQITLTCYNSGANAWSNGHVEIQIQRNASVDRASWRR